MEWKVGCQEWFRTSWVPVSKLGPDTRCLLLRVECLWSRIRDRVLNCLWIIGSGWIERCSVHHCTLSGFVCFCCISSLACFSGNSDYNAALAAQLSIDVQICTESCSFHNKCCQFWCCRHYVDTHGLVLSILHILQQAQYGVHVYCVMSVTWCCYVVVCRCIGSHGSRAWWTRLCCSLFNFVSYEVFMSSAQLKRNVIVQYFWTRNWTHIMTHLRVGVALDSIVSNQVGMKFGMIVLQV